MQLLVQLFMHIHNDIYDKRIKVGYQHVKHTCTICENIVRPATKTITNWKIHGVQLYLQLQPLYLL